VGGGVVGAGTDVALLLALLANLSTHLCVGARASVSGSRVRTEGCLSYILNGGWGRCQGPAIHLAECVR
jgi:hypothetical protein